MKPRHAIKWAALCIAGAIIGYLVAVWVCPHEHHRFPPPHPTRMDLLMYWLDVSVDQREAIERADPTYINDSEALIRRLRDKRVTLAKMLHERADNDAIAAQLDEALQAEETLERRTATFVLKIRPLLSIQQQQKLFDLLAKGLSDNAGPHLYGQPPYPPPPGPSPEPHGPSPEQLGPPGPPPPW